MASFTPPPSSQLQPFTVPAPQQSDALETLAKLRQNRLQNMQAQQAQLKMQSQQALMQAFAQAGRDPDELWKVASSRGDILPDDLVTLQNHMLETQTKVANLDEKNRAKLIFDTDRYAGLMQGVTTREGVRAANARAAKMNLFGSKQFDPIDPETLDEDTLADSLTLHVNALLGQSTMAKRLQEQATLAQTQAGTASSEASAGAARLLQTKTGQEIDENKLEAMIAEVRRMPDDPTTPGVPTLKAWNTFRAKYKDVDLPSQPSKEYIARLAKSTVAEKDIPEYEMKANMAAQGMTGTTYWDQYLFNEAQALGKKPAELTPIEKRKIFNDFKKLEENPVLTALGETNKRLTNQVLGAQVAGILTPAQIDSVAQELLSGDMAPDQIKELKPGGRVNQGGQVIQRARELAKAAGKPFSFMELEMAANQREKTLNEFNSTLVSHVGGQRLALNVLIHHADLYMDAAAALKNNTFRPGNEVYNKISAMMGSPAPSNAALIAQFFASETGKVATGGVPAEGEIRAILQNLGTSGSPEAMEGAGKTLMGIAAGRMIPMKALRDRNRLQKFVDILDPDSTEILERRGFDPETMKPRAGGGGGKIAIPLKSGRTAYADTQEQANKFKRENPQLVK